jgi:hypothetical protein
VIDGQSVREEGPREGATGARANTVDLSCTESRLGSSAKGMTQASHPGVESVR